MHLLREGRCKLKPNARQEACHDISLSDEKRQQVACAVAAQGILEREPGGEDEIDNLLRARCRHIALAREFRHCVG